MTDDEQQIADALRAQYASEDYKTICPHCHHGDGSWADNIANLVMNILHPKRGNK